MRTAAVILLASLVATPALAQEGTAITITIKNHKFEPARPTAPANRPLILRIRNFDPIPIEFESVSLRVEKVVVGNSEGLVHLRALSPGDYQFFDDFHQETRGALVVTDRNR